MSTYWEDRQKSRLLRSEQIGVATVDRVMPIYEQALKNINSDINSIYKNYADKVGLDVSELSKILSGADKNNFIKDIQKKMRLLGFEVSDIYDEKYIARLTRLEALKQQVYWEIQAIAPQEIDITTKAYRRIINESYKSSREDIRGQLGKSAGFTTINSEAVSDLLREKWLGANYSTRIWVNTSRLTSKIETILGAGLTVGTSQEKMQRQLREGFDVGRNNAIRLIRTETNYFQNQAELESYKDEGINYYKYDAVLDGRTSRICEDLDGDIFKVSQAVVGENYPPMHPNCRSSTQIVFDNEYVNNTKT